MQEIKVEVRSEADGTAYESVFPAGRIVVGRRMDCDLVLDAKHALASGRHLAIESEGAGLIIEDLNSTNGTLINDEPITGRRAIAPQDRVVLGKGGPVLLAELVGDRVDLLDTLEGDDLEAVATRAVALDTPAPLPAPTPDKKPVGLGTMGSMIQAAARRERRLTVLLVLMALAFAGTTTYILRREAEGSAEREAIRTEIRAESGRLAADGSRGGPQADDFQAVLGSAAESVYVVIKRTERAGDSSRIVESGSGTAFSIQDGFLGTNGHVAERFSSLASGETLIARSNALPSVDLRIVGVRIHPGFQGFSDLIERLRPYDKSSSEVLALPPAYDVALFEIHPDDIPKQAGPLPLASDADVYALRSGQPVAFVGFPGEGLIRGGTDLVRPSAKTALGSINRVIDPFFGRAEDVKLAECVEYNIEVVGGASGSPVVNGRGEVVGLINAGDVISEANSARVSIGGTSYGPRADTIRSLVEGRAGAAWAELRPHIVQRMLQIFRDGSGEIEEHAGQVGTKLLEIAAASIDVSTAGKYSWTFKGTVELKEPGRPGVQFLDVPTGDKGLRAIVAIAVEKPIGFQMTGSGRGDREKLIERSRNDEPISTVDARLLNPNVANETVRVEFLSVADEFFEPGSIAVYVLRVD